MGTSGKFRRPRRGFTLVELLTVIVIIGILAGLITAAAINARSHVKTRVVLSEIGQIDLGLQRYKTEFGELPPDFALVSHPLPAVALVAQDQVLRHLRKRFQKYRPIGDTVTPANTPTPWSRFCFDVSSVYGVNPATFDADSALVFWMGGLPERVPAAGDPWLPSGFHTDPIRPFKLGSPRTETFYEFDPDRLVGTTALGRHFRYYPRGIEEAPLVYFKSVKSPVNGRYEYGTFPDPTATPPVLLPVFYLHEAGHVAVPYLKQVPAGVVNPADPAEMSDATRTRQWESLEGCQIICSGFDGCFGTGDPLNITADFFRVTETGMNFDPDGADFDNLTSFSTSELEDGIE